MAIDLLNCNGQLNIEYHKYRHVNAIDCDELPFEAVKTKERSGGNELLRQAIHNFPRAAGCGEVIEVVYNILEYTEDTNNNEDVSVGKNKVIQKCTIQIQSNLLRR